MLPAFAQTLDASSDLDYFASLRKKAGHDEHAFKEVKTKMIAYYLRLEKNRTKTQLVDRLLKNAEKLENDPEGYAIYALVANELLVNRKEQLNLTKIMHLLERKLTSIKNEKLRFHSENNIGSFYKIIGKFRQAEHYTKVALNRAMKLKDTTNIQILNYNLGSISFFKNDFKQAESYLRKAIYLEQFGYRDMHFKFQMALALILENDQGKVKEAIAIYKEIEHMVPVEMKGGYYNNLGNLLLSDSQYQEAEQKLLLAKDYYTRSEDVNIELTYANLAKCYAKLKDFEHSYHYLLLKDSVVKVQQKDKHLALLERLKKQELVQIAKLEKKNARAKLAFERSKSVSFLISLVFALLLLGSAVWMVVFMRRKIKQLVRVNLQQMDNTTETKQEHKTKKKISAELIDKLEESINESKIYTDPDITIHKLASLLTTNVTDLSLTINHHYNVSFRTLINTKRVELAKRMLIEKKYEQYSMAGIAQSVGYLNNSSFYKHFRELTGVTPANFKSYALQILDEDAKERGAASQTAE